MIPEHIKNRKGVRSLKDLDPEVLEYLNAGKIQTKNLIEWLATDQLILLKGLLDKLGKSNWYSSFEEAVRNQKKPTANSNTRVIGETFALFTDLTFIKKHLADHTSDVVRCWACWAESLKCDTTETLLNAMKPYAADKHFGLREVVIFASKERLVADLDNAVAILLEWTTNQDENVRRYAVECMRPLGVWTKKIAKFQEDPSKGKALLEPLKSDPSKYVQDSVANWLNDASKSQPDWVKDICSRWEKESATKETAYIVKRGLRTINKASK